jgi:hypothetical protein
MIGQLFCAQASEKARPKPDVAPVIITNSWIAINFYKLTDLILP